MCMAPFVEIVSERAAQEARRLTERAIDKARRAARRGSPSPPRHRNARSGVPLIRPANPE